MGNYKFSDRSVYKGAFARIRDLTILRRQRDDDGYEYNAVHKKLTKQMNN